MPKKKVTKREAVSKRHALKISKGEETKFFDSLRRKVEFYCKDPSLSKKDQQERRKELADHLGISLDTLKALYLYGSNKENVYKAAIFIQAIDEDILMRFLDSYPMLVDDLNELPVYLRSFFSNFQKLNQKEQELLSNLVENLLDLNQKYSQDS